MSKFIIPVLDSLGNKVYFQTSDHKGQQSVDGYQSVLMWLEKNGFKVATNVSKPQTKPLESTTPPTTPPICGIHNKPMVWKTGVSKTTGKPYAFWSCNEKMPDGSWCKFKPQL